MAIFASSDGKGNVTLYGASAISDGQGHVTLLEDEYEEGEVIAEDEVSISLVDTSEYATHEEADEASKTATNFADFEDGTGVVVGNMTSGTLGQNVMIGSNRVDIRDGKTVLATFKADEVELGKGGIGSTIDLCDGAGTITAAEGVYNGGLRRLEITGGDSVNIDGGSGLDMIAGHKTKGADYPIAQSYASLDSYDTFGESVQAAFKVYSEYAAAKNAFYSAGIEAFINHTANPYVGLFVESATNNYMTMYGDRTEFSAKVQSTAETTPFRHIHPTTGRSVGFGVGSGGSYAGLYDFDKDGWVMRFDQSDLSLRGPSGLYRPYFTAGDTFSVTIRTAGYCTSSKSQVQYCIPLGKPVIGVSSVSVTTDADGGYKLRQDGNYTHGSGQSTYTRPNSHSATYSPQGMVFAIATFGNTTNAVNNDAIGIEAVINVTFNA